MARSSDRIAPVDVVVGASARVVGATGRAVRGTASVLVPAVRLGLRPPLLPRQFHPALWLGAVGREGADRRLSLRADLSRWLDVIVPTVLAEVLRRVDLTQVLLRYVDLDTVVAAVDLDRAATRLDVDAVVRRADLDEIVRRLDVDRVVERVDVDAVVARVDVDAVVDRVNLDAVAQRLDIDAVLDRLDLTSVVLERVDLDVLIQSVLGRVDLIALAEQVIDGVDLQEIIRESTGTMASDTVRGARMQGIAADEAVGRAVDRLLLRHGRRSTQAPGERASARPAEPAIPTQDDGTR